MKNIMKGRYNVGSCRKSCHVKAMMMICSSLTIIQRHYVREEYVRKYFKDQKPATVRKCRVKNRLRIMEFTNNCTEKCYDPCFEQNFRHKQKYLRKKVKLPSTVKLSFYYEDAKETSIEHIPRYDVVTLVSNFGGQLGLMVGMSALSFMEVLVWLILLVVDGLHRLLSNKRH